MIRSIDNALFNALLILAIPIDNINDVKQIELISSVSSEY